MRQLFSDEGPFRQADVHFKARAHQIQFAQAVACAIENREKLVVEAGTGTGKTYAYLVPVLLSGKKAIISTATKGLQDQLFERDLPHVKKILNLPVRVALLKGRNNYYCIHRAHMAQQEMMTFTTYEQQMLRRIFQWASLTVSGDLAQMGGLDEASSVIPAVTSNRDNCLGSDCPNYQQCYLVKARREAMAAEVVVINHHLFFADLAVRESGVAELLPTADVVVFDEAHQMNDIGLQFLGTTWSTSQVLEFGRDLLAAGLAYAKGLQEWQQLRLDMEQAVRELRLVAKDVAFHARLPWDGVSPEGIDAAQWSHALTNMDHHFEQAQMALQMVNEMAPELTRLYQRCQLLRERLARFKQPKATSMVRWVEVGQALRLVESPLDISDAMHERSYQNAQSWVFTSATLGADPQLSWFTKQVGLTDAKVLRFESPFDYAKQAAVYVPKNLPKPGSTQHLEQIAELAFGLIMALGGRTFILTTTLRALKVIGGLLQERFVQGGVDVDVLVQGQMPKRELIEKFRRFAYKSVLVGSQTFWEGIDVAGDDLQLVVIDKLPFPPPDDPLIKALCERVEHEHGSSFNDVFLPMATLSLKQGAGRLIRRESDRGALVIGDPRLVKMGYGKRILSALPPMRRLERYQDAQAYLVDLRGDDAQDSP